MNYSDSSVKIEMLFQELHDRVAAFIGENPTSATSDSLEMVLNKTIDSNGGVYYTFTLEGSIIPEVYAGSISGRRYRRRI